MLCVRDHFFVAARISVNKIYSYMFVSYPIKQKLKKELCYDLVTGNFREIQGRESREKGKR